MNNWKQHFLLVILLLLFIASSSAQPSKCYATFDPLRTCNSHYISNEFVFVGRLISADEKTIKIDGEELARVRVTVEESIKGNLSNGTRELFLEQRCHGRLELGGKYIFTAYRMKTAGFNALVSAKWSTTLKDIPDNELANILNKVRAVIKGKKQPALVGIVVEHDSDPLENYAFWGKSLDTRLGYNPQFSSALTGVEITAKPVDGNLNPLGREFHKTKTNPDGSYEFGDLPTGFYELSLALPKVSYSIRAYHYEQPEGVILDITPFRQIKGEKIFVKIENGICSEDLRFLVRPAGKIKGELIFENPMPSEKKPSYRFFNKRQKLITMFLKSYGTSIGRCITKN